MSATDSRGPSPAPILIAMVAGAISGWLSGADAQFLGLDVLPLFQFLGTLFLNLLKMLVVPLIAASIITAVSSLGSGHDLGRLGFRAFSFYLTTTISAILIALAIVNVVKPGIVDGTPARELLALDANAGEVAQSVSQRASASVADTILAVVPSNIIEAAASGKLLGVVFFSLLFGVFLARIEAPYQQAVADFWQGMFRVLMRMTQFVMRLAPLGVFGLTAYVVSKSGVASVGPMLVFAVCVILGLLIYSVLVIPLIVRLAGGANPLRLFSGIAPALITAFSTASSSATLPISLDCLKNRCGVSDRVASFVMPLGVSVNHAGSALYECAGAMFIAQAYGLDLSLSTQLTIVVLALITSMGIAGIPAASLVAIAVILAAVGLPPEGVAALLVVDRVLDMLRTAVNVLADAACAVIVARREGESDVLASSAAQSMTVRPERTGSLAAAESAGRVTKHS